jgi:putative transposase
MITDLSEEYSISKLCEVLELPRSTYYHQGQEKAGDQALRAEIEKVIARWPTYGYRRVTHQLKRTGHAVGETRVRRLLEELEHTSQVGKVRFSTTDTNIRAIPI